MGKTYKKRRRLERREKRRVDRSNKSYEREIKRGVLNYDKPGRDMVPDVNTDTAKGFKRDFVGQ